MHRLYSFLVMAFIAGSAQAMTFDAQLSDPVQEKAAQNLFHELRCIVCEGQSLAESNAVFAQQMRSEIRRRIAGGDEAAAVKDYFVERYGAQILQTPPLSGSTLLLWAMPALLLAGAAWLLLPRTRGVK